MPLKTLLSILALFCIGAFSLARADSYTARDVRQPIPVTIKERNQFLFEMRELLHGLFNMHLALSKGDYQAAATAVRPMGGLLDKIPPTLRERLPEDFVQIGIALRESVEAVANTAEQKKDLRAVQAQLAETMTYCSGCHDTYRFDVRAVVPAKK